MSICMYAFMCGNIVSILQCVKSNVKSVHCVVCTGHRRKTFPVLFSCAWSVRRLPALINTITVSGLVRLLLCFCSSHWLWMWSTFHTFDELWHAGLLQDQLVLFMYGILSYPPALMVVMDESLHIIMINCSVQHFDTVSANTSTC